MTSRRDLYAMGEPFGGSATRAKPGGGYVCGGGGDSSSSNTNQNYQTTNQYDQRQVFDQRQDNRSWSDSRSWTNQQTDARQFSTSTSSSTSNSNSGNTTITALDGGAIKSGESVALAGIENNQVNTKALLAVADSLFTKTADSLSANTKLAQALAGGAQQAYADATAQGAGNKNIVYAGLAVVGLAAVTMLGKK